MRDEGVIYVAGHPLLNSRCTRLPGCIRLRNDLYCVEWGVKLYSLTHSLEITGNLRTPKNLGPVYRSLFGLVLNLALWRTLFFVHGDVAYCMEQSTTSRHVCTVPATSFCCRLKTHLYALYKLTIFLLTYFLTHACRLRLEHQYLTTTMMTNCSRRTWVHQGLRRPHHRRTPLPSRQLQNTRTTNYHVQSLDQFSM